MQKETIFPENSYINNKKRKEELFYSSNLHESLKKEIDYYIDFIGSFYNEELFPSSPLLLGVKSIKLNNIFISAQKSIYNSYKCCCSGSLGDAYMLLRKCRDDLFFFLYFISLFDQLDKIYYNKIFDKNSYSLDDFKNELDEELKLNFNACIAWIDDKVHELETVEEKQKLNCANYLNIIKKDKQIKKIFSKGLSSYWYDLTNKLNNYTHTNGHKYILDNNFNLNNINNANVVIKKYIADVEWIISAFTSIYFLIKPNIVMSDDYIDYLELGVTPPEDSQYWVKPMYSDFVNNHINKCFPSIANYIKKNNKYGMIYD